MEEHEKATKNKERGADAEEGGTDNTEKQKQEAQGKAKGKRER